MNISKKKYIEILEGKSNFLNIGSNQEESISNIARIIKQVVGFKGVIRNDLSKPDGVKRKKLNLKLINKLGWKPKITLKKGIKLTYKSFLQNY
jgi:GDP-L-fucose synthase